MVFQSFDSSFAKIIGDNMSEAISCLVRVGENIKKNRLIKLDRDQVTVGRSGDVNYAILSNMISRCHAILKRQDDGNWSLTDNKSLNGVYVNGRQLVPFKACQLEDGDMVQFGVPTCPEVPAEFIYKFHISLKVRVEKKNAKRLREDQTVSKDSSIDNPGSQSESDGEDRKRKVSMDSSSMRKETPSMGSKEAEYQARLAQMEKLLQEKELKQSEIEKQLKKEREERESRTKEIEELRIKEHAILVEMQDKQTRLEKEKEELKQKMQAELEANVKEKEHALMSQLEDQKQLLVGEKKRVEESLQAEMAKALEMKNIEVEERLINMKENLEKVIEKKDNEQKLLINQLDQTREENECAKLQALKAREDVLSNFVDLMEVELQCAICNELFIKATALNCAHVFCKLCINQWMKVKKECPNCRNKITSHMQAIALDSYIEKMVEQLSDDLKEKRKILLEQRKVEQDNFDGVVAGPSRTPAAPFPPMVGVLAQGATRGRGRARGGNRGGRGRNTRGRGINTRAHIAAAVSTTAAARTTAPATTSTTVSTATTTQPTVSTSTTPATVNLTTIVLSDDGSDEEEEDSEEEIYGRGRHFWRRALDSDSDEDDDSVDGVPSEYFGGYGRCFKCGARGHWANGCPF